VHCSFSQPAGESAGKCRVIPAVLPHMELPEEGRATFPLRKIGEAERTTLLGRKRPAKHFLQL